MGKVQKIILGVFLLGFFLNLGEIASASNIEKLFKQYEKVEFISAGSDIYTSNTEEASGYYIVQKNKLFGILSMSGEIVVPLEYNEIIFGGGMFILEKDKQFSIMKNDLELKTKKYDKVVIDESMIFAYIGDKIDVFLNNEEILDIEDYKKYGESLVVKKNGKYGFKDMDSYDEVKFIYDTIEYDSSNSNSYRDRFYGYIGNKKYILGYPFENKQIPNVKGIFIESLGKYYIFQNGKNYSLYDIDGVDILGKSYHDIKLFSEGKYALLTLNGFQSLMFTETKKILFTNHSIEVNEYFSYEDRLVIKINNKILVLQENGDILLSGIDDISVLMNYETSERYFLISKKDKDGLYGSDGKKIYAEIYDNIDFYNGVFILTKSGKSAFADEKGKVLTGYEYESIEDGYDKNFIVKKGGKYGIIDNQQKLIIPIQYESIEYDYNYGLFVGKKLQTKDFFTITGKKIDLGKYQSYEKMIVYESLYANSNGEMENFNKESSFTPYPSGDVMFEGYKVGKNGKYGIVNNEGSIILPIEFTNILGFQLGGKDGRTVFVIENNLKYGLRDIQNKKLLPIEYDTINVYFDEIIIAKKQSKMIGIGIDGKEIISGIKNLKSDSGYVIVEKNNGKKGVVLGGKIIIQPNFNQIFVNQNIIFALTENRTIWYNVDGTKKAEYDFIFDEIVSSTELIIKKGEKYGSIYSNNIFVKPQFDSYEAIGYFLANIEIGGKKYVYNILNNKKIPGVGINAISNNLFFTQSGSHYGIKNMSGEVVLKDEYKNIMTLGEENQKFLVQKDNKVFIIDASEKVLETIDADSFDYSDVVVNGEYFILLKKGVKSGLMNVKGEMLIDIQYDNLTQNNFSIIGKKGNTYYYFSDEMKPVLESENGELNIDIIDENYGIIEEASEASEYIVECQCNTNEGTIVDLKTLKPIVDKKFILTGERRNNVISFVDSDKKAGFLDLKTKKITYLKWQFIKDLSGGNYLVSNKDEFKLSVINSKGKVLKTYPYKLSSTRWYDKDFFVIVNIDGKEGILDVSGKVLFTPKTKYLYSLPENNIYLASNDELNYAVFIGEKQTTGYDYSDFTYMKTHLILEKGKELFTLQLKDGTIEKIK